MRCWRHIVPVLCSAVSRLEVLNLQRHPLRIEDPHFGHEVEVDEGHADQQVLQQKQDWSDKAKEGDQANTHDEKGKVL